MASGCIKPAAGGRMPPEAALLGLDWGTTSLRGYLIGADGSVLAERSAEAGILQVRNGAFAEALSDLAGDWLASDSTLPIIASGMIGSRQGWVEVPYVDLPADAGGLTLYSHDGFDRPIHFIPGLAVRDGGGVPDVMRGEETQIIGAGGLALQDGLYLLPGSHTKWAEVKDGNIIWFTTFMTGELFAALKGHTILGRMMMGEADDDVSFRRGVNYGQGAGGTLQRLFSARTLALFGELPETGVADYLSGLLIGAEIAEARALVQNPGSMIMIIGNPDLSRHYLAALSISGWPAEIAPAGATARGHWRIARAAGLLPR
ncbi:MAG: 2-dehydro-3-deoxygalactonokinase [Alphaproteobacteria bacterium]|nr:2-dehydro-3-deoxygalactonokinase [Alphaproteobacteria bacterium]